MPKTDVIEKTETKIATAIEKTETKIATVNFDLPDDYSIDINSDDVKIPNVVLWQKMTDMLEFEDAGVKAGEFVNPVTITNYGNSFDALVVKYYTTARIWGTDSEGQREVVKYSPDGMYWFDGTTIDPSEYKWTEDGSHALKSYHYLVIVKGEKLPAVVTFKGASAKFAKGFNANLLHCKPSWKQYFTFNSAQAETAGNKYHVIQCKPNTDIQLSQDEATFCLNLWKSVQGKTIGSTEKSGETASTTSDGLPS